MRCDWLSGNPAANQRARYSLSCAPLVYINFERVLGDVKICLPVLCNTMKLIKQGDEALVKEIDKSVKNKFRWSWLDRTVTISVKIGNSTEELVEKLADYIVKCDVAGKSQCLYCDKITSILDVIKSHFWSQNITFSRCGGTNPPYPQLNYIFV